MREHSITTPDSSAIAPPERPVPAPRGTKGTPFARQARTTRATSRLVARQHDRRRPRAVYGEPVGLVDQQILGPREAAASAPDDLAQRGDERSACSLRRGARAWH